MSTQDRPWFILVNGMPGTGKTTLSRRLATDLGLPLIAKDALKEFLFDHFATQERELSRMLGKVTADMLFELTEGLLGLHRPFIVECAFWYEFAQPEMTAIIQKHSAQCIEIHCVTDREERVRRFVSRNESGDRHPGHVDTAIYEKLRDEAWEAQFSPLRLEGSYQEVDTTTFDEAAYQKLLSAVQQSITTFSASHVS